MGALASIGLIVGVLGATVDAEAAGTLTVLNDSPLEAEAFAWYRIDGFPGREARVAQCALPLGPSLASSPCAPAQHLSLEETGDHGSTAVWVNAGIATADGAEIDCRVVPCVLAGFTVDGVPVAEAPLHFRKPLSLALDPAGGLLDGDLIRVTIEGLPPGGAVSIVRCVAGAGAPATRCEQPVPAAKVANGDGVVVAPVAAAQRLTTGGRYRYCRDDCTIAAVAGDGSLLVETPYRMTEPELTLSTAADLVDGEAIVANGTGVQPSYVGPRLFLPTGGWAFVQCAAVVGSDPDLASVLRWCGQPGGVTTPDVIDATATSTLEVRATLGHFLGGATDCTVADGACVLGLVRWEQDATVSRAFVPLAFT